MKQAIEEQVKVAALKYKVPLRFLMSLVAVESGFNPFAFRHERGYIWLYSVKEIAEMLGVDRKVLEYAQKSSFGLVQIMGANVYEMGFRGWIGDLFLPDLNLKFGCDFIHILIKRHNLSFAEPLDLYSAYNAGSVRKNMEGNYVNATAVGKFRKQYEIFRDLI